MGSQINIWRSPYIDWGPSNMKMYYACPFRAIHPLTDWGRVTHICVGNLNIIGSDNVSSPGSAPSHYLNQCWNIVNWTLRNKLQWIFKWNSNIFIQENAFQCVVCEITASLSQCVNSSEASITSTADDAEFQGLLWPLNSTKKMCRGC